jgi:peptidoglycan L-alanyl-D-glutamate endopeptidase CwlK
MGDTSRDPADLHPLLRERYEYMMARWADEYPMYPKPFLTATYRGPIDQRKAKTEGKSKVDFGFSLHNFKPAYAFDLAFLHAQGHADWSFHLFEKMARFGEEVGLEWGGRWPGLVDGPHFQLPMTPEQVKRGDMVMLPPIPESSGPWKIVVLVDGVVKWTWDAKESQDVVVRYSADRKRIYLDVKKEGE